MENLFRRHDAYLSRVPMEYIRDFMQHINWNSRLLVIRGPKGVGKSTLMQQYIKQHFPAGDRHVLYCSADTNYFSTHTLLDLAETFVMMGGKWLFIDEVHKYPGWSREIKEIYDLYNELHIVLSGSSLVQINDGQADLSRRLMPYDMPGLSLREFIHLDTGLDIKPVSLDQLLDKPSEVCMDIISRCHPLEHFGRYRQFGYYPFYLKNPIDYYPLIEQVTNYVIDVELPQLRKVNPSNCRKVKALLNVLAQQVPFDVDISKMASMIELQRNTVIEYLGHLADAKLIHLLYSDLVSVKKMQKPDKIYLENPNLFYALATTPVKIGTVRECFAVNQLSYSHKVEYGKQQGDFKVDGKWTFEVGGEGKTFDQIADLPNSYILADDIESPHGNKLPLWMVGLIY